MLVCPVSLAMKEFVAGEVAPDMVLKTEPPVTLKKLSVNGEVPLLQLAVRVSYCPESRRVFEAVRLIVGAT